MNSDAKIINKIIVSQIKQHIKRITQHDQVEFVHEYTEGSTYENLTSINTPH